MTADANTESSRPATATAVGPPRLADLQALFQKAILDGDETIFRHVRDSSRTTRKTLFGVYAHGYLARLIEILRNDYPLLAGYVGEETFATLATSYIRRHPSHTPNARWFGAGLPEHLGALAEFAPRPELSELAAIERATSDAFDAADAAVLAIDDLARHAPESWPLLVFAFHPSTRVLSLQTNAFVLWRALRAGEVLPALEVRDAVQSLCVWRQDATPRLRVMADEEAMMWIEAADGARFEALCEMLATARDPESAPVRAVGYLQSWIAAGLLSSVRIGARPVKVPLELHALK